MNSIACKSESNNLFTIHSRILNGKPAECVNARDLHSFMGIGRDFSTWIKDRIKQYGFEKSLDYITVSRAPESGSGNRGASTDYFTSIDMAKELSMVERNDKGRQARRYFIDCEKSLKDKLKQESKQAALPLDQPRLAHRYLVEQKEGQLGSLVPIPEEAVIVTIASLPKLIKERVFIEPMDLQNIGQACMDRLAKKALIGR